MQPSRLAAPRLLAYAMPGVPEAMILYCASVVIPGFYATEAGLSTAFIGIVLTASRIFDAVIDIAIGYLSDRTRTRLGARKPWLIAGTILCIAAVLFLYQPGSGDQSVRYVAATFALYLGWTMAIIPYDAWGSELSSGYEDRSRIFTYRAIAYYLGSILFLATPLLPIFETHAFSADVLAFNALLVAVLFTIATWIAVVYAPTERPDASRVMPTMRGLLAAIRDTKPLQYYIVIYFLSGLSLGIFLALTFIYLVSYLKLAEEFSLILLVYVAANLVALPLWHLVLQRMEKHKAWAVGVFLNAVCYPPLFLLEPTSDNLFWIVLATITASGAFYSVANVTSKAVLGDIADYDLLKSGINRTANFFAIAALVNKANIAAGGGLAFLALAIAGYDPSRPDNSALAIMGLKSTFLIVPAILGVVAACFMWRFPITKRRHDIIRARLDRRLKRRSASEPRQPNAS